MAAASIFQTNPVLSSRPSLNLSIQAQTYIRDCLWNGAATCLTEYASYFRYFQWTVNTVIWPSPATEPRTFTVQTYQDLTAIVQYMGEHGDESRSEIADKLCTYFPQSSRSGILRSMDLAVRLWMTIHLRSAENPIGPQLSNVTAVQWNSEQSLRNLIGGIFPKAKRGAISPAFKMSSIDPSFIAMNIRRFCRIQVRWTHNLRDHLRFDLSAKTLYVYPHKVCLLSHLEHGKIYPKDFLLETLRTLDLLFPYGDKSTELWLEKNSQPFHRTSSPYIQTRARKLEEFRYWNRQLSELYHIFLQPPTTVAQMWYDKRNPMQWYTFWLAAFIAVFTLIFGSLGTYIGFKQIQLAEKSIRISLNPDQ